MFEYSFLYKMSAVDFIQCLETGNVNRANQIIKDENFNVNETLQLGQIRSCLKISSQFRDKHTDRYSVPVLLLVLANIKQGEDDPFYNIAKILLNFRGTKLNKLHIYNGSPAYYAVEQNNDIALRLILQHPDFDVNKTCECCKDYKLPIHGLRPGNSNVVKLLVEAGANVNTYFIDGAFRGQTPLYKFIHGLGPRTRFSTHRPMLKDLQYLLENEFKFNQEIDISSIIQEFPFDICELLLNFGIEKLNIFTNTYHWHRSPTHIACMIGSDSKILLLREKCHKEDFQDIGRLLHKRAVIRNSTDATINIGQSKPRYSDENTLESVISCRQFLKHDETRYICNSIFKVVNDISRNVAKHFKTHVVCELSGSFKENTKVFQPNEFDFIFKVPKKSNIIDITHEIYSVIEDLIEKHPHSLRTGDERFKTVSLLRCKRISKVHLVWNGSQFENLDILVDIVICNGDEIVKYKGYYTNEVGAVNTFHDTEQSMFNSLSTVLKQGYILAKAVRLAAIAQPMDIGAFELCENINVDDVITSYMLRSCLIGVNIDTSGNKLCKTPSEAAITIYQRLKTIIHKKAMCSMYPYYLSGPCDIFDCTQCTFERGCCKNLKLMLAMTDNILQWLTEHHDTLNKIDFVMDTNIFKDLQLKLSVEHRWTGTEWDVDSSLTESANDSEDVSLYIYNTASSNQRQTRASVEPLSMASTAEPVQNHFRNCCQII